MKKAIALTEQYIEETKARMKLQEDFRKKRPTE